MSIDGFSEALREDYEDRFDGEGVGANSYVRKPVESSEFAAAVGQLGVYRSELTEPPPLRTT